jgi:GT2 family glycosyltransferase
MTRPDVSVVMVNWNTRDLTDQAITSLRTHEKRVSIEIILVDNASSDGSASYLESRHPDITIIRNTENVGFARANNQGAKAASGAFILLLNSDTLLNHEVLPTCLEVAHAQAPAIVGCRLLNADGTLQPSTDAFPSLGAIAVKMVLPNRHLDPQAALFTKAVSDGVAKVDWICGAFMLMPRTVYLDLGGLAEDIFMYGEDAELCWRARQKGVGCYYVPSASIVHFGGGSVPYESARSLMLSDAGRLRAFAKMRGHLPALLMRILFIVRSLGRGLGFTVLGLLKRDPSLKNNARRHLMQAVALTTGRTPPLLSPEKS